MGRHRLRRRTGGASWRRTSVSRRRESHLAPDVSPLSTLRSPAACGWPHCVRVPGNPREFRRPEGAELVHGEFALVTPSASPCSGWIVVIAQRGPGRDLEMLPAADGHSGNPRESTQKWSGAGRWIHTWCCTRGPLTVSGSRTERTGDHELERVPDLRFCVVRDDSAVKVSRLRELVDNSPSYLGASELQRMSGR